MKLFPKKVSLFDIFFVMVFFLILLIVHRNFLIGLGKQLIFNEDYSFGLFLPAISIYIVYLKWPQLKALPRKPSWTGLSVIASGFGLFFLGEIFTDFYLPTISFIVVSVGLLMVLVGTTITRELFIPILLLILMIPLPFFITQKVTLPLQLLSSHLAAGMLQFFSYPAFQQGNIIDLGTLRVQVVEACSGLRYVLSLLAIGIIYCYFFQRNVWKSLILLSLIVPAAIFTNAARLACVAIFPVIQDGFWHYFSSWLIFIFCFLFLAIFNWALNKLKPEEEKPARRESPNLSEILSNQGRPNFRPRLIAALALVIFVFPLALQVSETPAVPLLQSFENFPMRIENWQGHHVAIDPDIVGTTGCSSYLNASFATPDGKEISLWIAYYENQKAGNSVHSPFSCLTGGGWHIKETWTADLAPGKPAKWILMDQGGTLMLVCYWYLQKGGWVTDEFLNKFFIGYNRLVRRRADGALIRLITKVEGNLEEAQKSITNFARAAIPLLTEFMHD